MSRHVIDGNLNGEIYRDILKNEMPTLHENLRLEVRPNMWFQHDGCPVHYSIVAREVLDHDFNSHRIGGAGPVNWPPRVPNFSSPDFFLWGYLKDKVYKQEPTTRENMIDRIRNACAEIQADTFLNVHSKCIEFRPSS